MRVAVIDLGTNTFHLLIAEIKNHQFSILYKTNVPVKLGEGKINDNLIIPEAFKRGIDTLKSFNETINSYHVDQISATATSAIRSAKNGEEFVTVAKAEAQISIKIITGDEEAQLIYNGVKLSGAITNTALIMDIGGGSIEFILCDNENIFWKKSYNIGAARLMQQYFHSDPISDGDKNAILFHVQNELADLFEICETYHPKTLIGSAGAFETFASLIIKKNNSDENIETAISYTFEYDDYIKVATTLINASHNQRHEMPGMIPLRVDMIVVAALITSYVLGRTQINQLKLSTYDLKMGVLSSYL
ncbi:exopolyphosphatase [Pedobacter changchengzhani]|uniref:Exopolyphosphatase n=1 Tax=Pedobacter changchengzhani TaxID=2529274 RepID=A0A4R5MM25_9SPHI|nr:exopolyphosphatase [Pedobacter changchengzhani]TDG36315.1 exopolyphosphatase [Pedobacter changchengzhani]